MKRNESAKDYIVYCHTNLLNGKKYIGITVNSMIVRWRKHLSEVANNSIRLFHKAIRKYGVHCWKHDVLQMSNNFDELLLAEKYWIKKYKTSTEYSGNRLGYNLTNGGDGSFGRIHSDISRKKMSVTRLEKGFFKGTKNPKYGRGPNMLGPQNGFWGKRHTKESKKKISDAKKNIPNPKIAIKPEIMNRIIELHDSGKSFAFIAKLFTLEGIKTTRGKDVWSPQVIFSIYRKNKKC